MRVDLAIEVVIAVMALGIMGWAMRPIFGILKSGRTVDRGAVRAQFVSREEYDYDREIAELHAVAGKAVAEKAEEAPLETEMGTKRRFLDE